MPSAPGDIRAYELRTGKLRWSFHTIPHPGEFGHETWPANAWQYAGGANSWSGMALDERRGLVFVPTGSAAFDFYGANRHGDNLFANCLLALRAETGERVWHFQAVRHDVWDRDLPSPPSLVQVRRDGRTIDAVAQITKSGHVYVFERETGKPLFPIENRRVPPSDVDGEVLGRRAAASRGAPAVCPAATDRGNVDPPHPGGAPVRGRPLPRVAQRRAVHAAEPEGTIVFPGFDGGGEWGGSAFDPESHLLYVNSNEMAWVLRLVPVPPVKPRTSGQQLYGRHCASCHRADLRGTPPEFPALNGIAAKYPDSRIGEIIRDGSGRMPGFANLQPSADRGHHPVSGSRGCCARCRVGRAVAA